jgi:hypothetical protein
MMEQVLAVRMAMLLKLLGELSSLRVSEMV